MWRHFCFNSVRCTIEYYLNNINHLVLTESYTHIQTAALWFQFAINFSNFQTAAVLSGISPVPGDELKCGIIPSAKEFSSPFFFFKGQWRPGPKRAKSTTQRPFLVKHRSDNHRLVQFQRSTCFQSSVNWRKFEFKAFIRHNARLQLQCWRAGRAQTLKSGFWQQLWLVQSWAFEYCFSLVWLLWKTHLKELKKVAQKFALSVSLWRIRQHCVQTHLSWVRN